MDSFRLGTLIGSIELTRESAKVALVLAVEEDRWWKQVVTSKFGTDPGGWSVIMRNRTRELMKSTRN